MMQLATIEPENGSPIPFEKVSRHRMLIWASVYLGLSSLAQVLGIEERSLRAKLAGARGVTDIDLARTVKALEARQRAIGAHVATIKSHLTQEPPCRTA